jgi:type IV secretory pathway VirB6-like protein
MRYSSFFTHFAQLIFRCLLVVFILVAYQRNAYAVYDGPRDNVSFDSGSGMCRTGEFKFNPLMDNIDVTWKFDNPTCAGFIAATGATMMLSGVASRVACKFPAMACPYSSVSVVAETPASAAAPPIAYLTPLTAVAWTLGFWQCANRSSEAAASSGDPVSVGPCVASQIACCSAVAAYSATIVAAVAVVASIYGFAKPTYENARICGYDWQAWNLSDDLDNNGNKIWKLGKGRYRKCVEQIFANNGLLDSGCADIIKKHEEDLYDKVGAGFQAALNVMHDIATLNLDGPIALISSQFRGATDITQISMQNKLFREYTYGGVEFRDNGENGCSNPSTWDHDRRMKNLGYDDDRQRYYMTGPGSPPSYACYRFLTTPKDEADRAATQAAFDCCSKRSQEAICIENKIISNNPYDYKFCTIGSRCSVSTIVFEPYESKSQSNYICAKTYSLCPYDHLLGGGTEKKKMVSGDSSITENYCQFMKHCVKRPIQPYVHISELGGAFISQACRDMRGDSQNVYGYSSSLIPVINMRGFSSPLVQCFKETMENLFLNKAGYTLCINPDEAPSSTDGTCISGAQFTKGQYLKTPSFFAKIQDRLQNIIKMVLTLSVAFFGVVTLFAVPSGESINKKRLYTYVLKIGLVMYFAVGDGWQFGFMNGLTDASAFLADVAFKNDESAPPEKLDGCQFPRFNYADSNESTKYTNAAYPPGKAYLRVWDTLDCKIGRALGFGPEVSVPNLIFMVLGGLLTGGLGIVFFVGTFLFAFFLISVTVKAMHIFLMSITAVVLLVYVSPITITAAMFERTKNIFTQWRAQIIGFTLQPMILFCYLGIVITLFDKMVIGSDVSFNSTTINVNGVDVVDNLGRISPKQISCAGAAADTSIYCIFRVADIKTYNGLEAIGIGLPILASMNATKLQTIIKVTFVMFIFTKFLDKISDLAAALVGGAALKSNWSLSTESMAKASFGAARAIQKRVRGAVQKHGSAAVRGGINKARSGARLALNKGSSARNISSGSGDSTPGSTGSTGSSDMSGSSSSNSSSAISGSSSPSGSSSTAGSTSSGSVDGGGSTSSSRSGSTPGSTS